LSPRERKKIESAEKQINNGLDQLLSGEITLEMLAPEVRAKIERLRELSGSTGR
jgi:hypothetical protein